MGQNHLFILAVFCHLLTVIGTSTTDSNALQEGRSTLNSPNPTGPQHSSTTVKPTTLNPKEAARLASLELSKQIFRDISKKLRDSIAAKNFSIFTTTATIDDQDELHPFRHQPKHHHEYHWGPYFDEPASGNGPIQVKAHLTSEALLNCRVGMLRDKTVTWLRKLEDKVDLLTVADTTYTGDSRIAVKFQYPNNWRLSISPVQKEDAGIYMCQVSTHPPRVLLTNVTVLAPILKIVDEQGHEVKDRYYKAGSSIELSCRVSRTYSGNFNSMTTTQLPKFTIRPFTTTTSTTTTSTESPNITSAYGITSSSPSFEADSNTLNSNQSSVLLQQSSGNENNSSSVSRKAATNSTIKDTPTSEHKAPENNVFGITWYKDGKVLTDKVTARNMSSTFKQEHAEQKDSGSYSCSIQNTTTVTVQVHVLSGETQAAVQHDTLNKAHQNIVHFSCLLTALLFLIQKNV